MHEPKRTRAEINRENAKKFTGPRTPEGKARSSRNATTHGLTAATPALQWEDAEAFETIRANILDDLQPTTGREYDLALEVAEAFWARARARRVQRAFFETRSREIAAETGNEITGDAALAQLLISPEDMQRMRLTLRYLTAADKDYKAALSEFRQVRRQHLEDLEAELSTPPPEPETILTEDEVAQAQQPHDQSPESVRKAAFNTRFVQLHGRNSGFVSKSGYLFLARECQHARYPVNEAA